MFIRREREWCQEHGVELNCGSVLSHVFGSVVQMGGVGSIDVTVNQHCIQKVNRLGRDSVMMWAASSET